MKLLAKGLGASAGTYQGKIRIIENVEKLQELQEGEILVVKKSNPAWTIGMMKAGAMISEHGGTISHMAIIAREMGIPCVVAVENATKKFLNGQVVLLDGEKGQIYQTK